MSYSQTGLFVLFCFISETKAAFFFVLIFFEKTFIVAIFGKNPTFLFGSLSTCVSPAIDQVSKEVEALILHLHEFFFFFYLVALLFLFPVLQSSRPCLLIFLKNLVFESSSGERF